MRSENVLYFVSFLDLLGVSMIIPSLGSHVKAMDGGSLLFGVIMSLYGLVQFISAPIAGRMSDVYGRRCVLLFCIGGASFGYLVLAMAQSISMLFISRLISAISKHTLDLVKISMLDHKRFRSAHRDTTASSIGRLNGMANLGFIIGPLIGGYISSWELSNGFQLTTLITVAIFGLNLVLVYRMYEDVPPSKIVDRQATQMCDEDGKLQQSIWHYVGNQMRARYTHIRSFLKDVGPAKWLLLARLLLATAAVMYRTHFSNLLEDKYRRTTQVRGFLLSYMGVLGAFGSHAVAVFTQRKDCELFLLQLFSCVYALSFLALSLAKSLEALCLWLIPQVVSLSILRACTISLQTKYVAQNQIGAFLGISSSLTSIARTIAPILSGYTYGISVDGPAIGSALLGAVSMTLFCSFTVIQSYYPFESHRIKQQ